MSNQRRATSAQIVQIHALLRDHIYPPRERGGAWWYEEEWSDERIRDEVGCPSVASVQKIRQECFGNLFVARAPNVAEPSSLPALPDAGKLAARLDWLASQLGIVEWPEHLL